jgi:rhodanese-related sulfurtransferase
VTLLLRPLIVTLALTATLITATAQDTPLNITPVEAARLVADKKAILIDIRTPEEWKETGVAEGAHRLDMNDPMFTAKLSKIVEGDRTKPVALICRTANRTRTVQAALMQQGGYSRVINVEGGMIGNSADKGWIAHGLPVKKED